MQFPGRLFALLILLTADGLATAANKTWTGSISSDWFDPGNWNPAGVPAEGDAVSVPFGNPIASSNVVAASLSIAGGTCTLNGPTDLGTLTLTGGTLAGTNVIHVTNLVWNRGTMAGLGVTRVAEGGSLSISVPQYTSVLLNQRVLHNAGS
ncbi:MAG: hypothetical protein JXQ71_00230, partial [Verrucomicrobia bacterium]|nr:hypothetical protein [Verrucomicrobiota bacterium]